MYVCPFDPVNFNELGEDNIGIGLETSYDGDTNVFLDNVCSITLVSWPIKQVTTMDGKLLQQYEDLHALDELQGTYEQSTLLVDPISKKQKYCFVNRKPKVSTRPSKKVNQVSLSAVQLVSVIDCCAKRCCQYANRDKVVALRNEFWGQTLQKRTNYVYDTMLTAWRENTTTAKSCYVFSFNGTEVCTRAWYEIHGIPKTSFYRYREQFENGVRRSVHGNEGVIRKGRHHTQMGRALIRSFVEENSEKMPHKSRTMEDGTRETLLVIPNTYKQVDILDDINKTLGRMGLQSMSSSTFNRIWRKEFANVTLSKTSEFSKCVVCSRIKSQLESTKDDEMIARLKDERRIHMLQQQSCRNVYYTWRKFSELQKDKYLCIIHDKMDQKKTAIPRLRVNSKDYANAY